MRTLAYTCASWLMRRLSTACCSAATYGHSPCLPSASCAASSARIGATSPHSARKRTSSTSYSRWMGLGASLSTPVARAEERREARVGSVESPRRVVRCVSAADVPVFCVPEPDATARRRRLVLGRRGRGQPDGDGERREQEVPREALCVARATPAPVNDLCRQSPRKLTSGCNKATSVLVHLSGRIAQLVNT
jgi:hypothetical protein